MHVSSRGCFLVACAALLALAGAGVYAYQHIGGALLSEGCTATTSAGDVSLSPDQAANAATITAVATRRGLPERAAVIAIATAMQESKLENLTGGDRDSLGLFQQRPSQGWGTESQILDPVYSANRFYDELVKVPRYTRLPLTVAAQRVQHSGAPGAYAQHEAEAQILGDTLSGRTPAGLTCALRPARPPRQRSQSNGLTPRADAVRRQLARAFGDLPSGGYHGSALDLAFRSANPVNRRNGWALAQWAVAHADALGIDTVIYDGKVWAVKRSGKGWRDYHAPKGAKTATALYRDRVHIAVLTAK
jgi:hypothetical protein